MLSNSNCIVFLILLLVLISGHEGLVYNSRRSLSLSEIEFEQPEAQPLTDSRNTGDPCSRTLKCSNALNLFCNTTTKQCQCAQGFTMEVKTGTPPSTICLKPANLGETCYHDQSCIETDENSICVQEGQNSVCRCIPDYDQIRDNLKLKCVPYKDTSNTDLITFIGIGVGMTLFCGLTCLVLRIFARARFGPSGRRRYYPTHANYHYANANNTPPQVPVSGENNEHQQPSGHHHHGRERGSSVHHHGGHHPRASIGSPHSQSNRRQSLQVPTKQGDLRRSSDSSIRSNISAAGTATAAIDANNTRKTNDPRDNSSEP